jgi:hypothetical protein
VPDENEVSKSLAIIAKSFAYLCLDRAGLLGGDIGVQARLLMALGLSPADCAGLLNSTERSIAELVRVLNKDKQKRGTKSRGKQNNR